MAQLFEFTENGIVFKDFQSLRDELKTSWFDVFGEELDLSPTSPDGHHLDLECKVIHSVSEMIQVIVSNLNRSTAKGQFLDFLAEFVGVSRHEGESDASLRSRMTLAFMDGYSTFDGMMTYLRNNIVSAIGLTTNDEDVVMDNIPPHSIRVTVPTNYKYSFEGAEYAIGTPECNNHIAQMIWNCKPAGIKTSGNSHGTSIDKAGTSHEVYFSVPSAVEIDVRIELEKYSEEAFPVDGSNLIKDAIVSWASEEFIPGKDVIPLRFFVPIFSIPGIKSAIIRVKKHGTSEWTTDAIAIESEQSALISKSNIDVVA